MDKKNFVKKYLKSALILFFALALITALIVFGISASSIASVSFTFAQKILICLGGAIVPTGSYTGFVLVFGKIEQINTFWKIAICVLFPVTLLVITLVGIVAVIPSIIYSIVFLTKKHNS